jgi:hypothetical protein
MEEAHQELAEALQIYRELAEKNPEGYRPYVATTLSNLAILDRGQSQVEKARKEYAETMQIYEGLAKQNPERFSPDVERVKKLLAELPN